MIVLNKNFNKFKKFHTKVIIINWKNFRRKIFLENYLFSKIIYLSIKDKKWLKFLSYKRKIEFLGIRYILKYLGINIKILYNKKRKPFFLKNQSQYISITHSYEKTAIGISNYPIGIDIEKIRENKKIINIKKKFIRRDESSFIPTSFEEDYLYIIWCIKESLYKLDGGIYYNFLNNYKVSNFCINKDFIIQCWIIKNSFSKKFCAFYRKIDGYYLIYVIDYSYSYN